MVEKQKILGAQGEAFAARWLVQHKGWRIVARNVQAQGGEIDIIAYDVRHNYYVLVEVKTRTHQAFALGVESVGLSKQKKMQQAAARFFLQQLKLKEVPEFEIHAMVLMPKAKSLPWQPSFTVQYYDDLS